MAHRVTRRSIIGLFGAGAVAAVGPVTLGWRHLVSEAAGTSSRAQPRSAVSPTPKPTFTPPPGSTIAGPAEEITFSGSVDHVLGPAEFVGSGKQV
jgi:hypothetical protein